MIQRLTSDKTPAAVGSYSAASKVGNLIFTSGQLPINAETGKIDQPDSIEWQVNQSLTNIKHILEDNGSSMQAVVKTTVYLADIADFLPLMLFTKASSQKGSQLEQLLKWANYQWELLLRLKLSRRCKHERKYHASSWLHSH